MIFVVVVCKSKNNLGFVLFFSDSDESLGEIQAKFLQFNLEVEMGWN